MTGTCVLWLFSEGISPWFVVVGLFPSFEFSFSISPYSDNFVSENRFLYLNLPYPIATSKWPKKVFSGQILLSITYHYYSTRKLLCCRKRWNVMSTLQNFILDKIPISREIWHRCLHKKNKENPEKEDILFLLPLSLYLFLLLLWLSFIAFLLDHVRNPSKKVDRWVLF